MDKIILAIDPGTEYSAYVILQKISKIKTPVILLSGYIRNECMITVINNATYDYIAVEGVSSFGSKVGNSTFKTCEWSGRFLQAGINQGMRGVMIYRKKKEVVNSIRATLCGKNNATTIEVKNEVKRRLPNSVGTRKAPGPLYLQGKDHLVAAAAVGLTFMDSEYFQKDL